MSLLCFTVPHGSPTPYSELKSRSFPSVPPSTLPSSLATLFLIPFQPSWCCQTSQGCSNLSNFAFAFASSWTVSPTCIYIVYFLTSFKHLLKSPSQWMSPSVFKILRPLSWCNPLFCRIVPLSIPHHLSCYVFVHFGIPNAQRSNLAHSGHSRNICWMSKWMQDLRYFPIQVISCFLNIQALCWAL